MQSTGTKSRKVIHQCDSLKALQVIGTPQQQLPQQQSAAKAQEVTVSAIAAAAAAAPFPSAAASVDSAVTLSTEQNISSILFRGRSVQEWVDIATRSLSQPKRNSEELILSPRSKSVNVELLSARLSIRWTKTN